MTSSAGFVAALRTNAICSIATGATLLAMPASVSDWLGVSIDGWLRLVGAGLVVHAIGLAWASTTADLDRWVRVNLALITPYPFLLVGLVAFRAVDSGEGIAILLLDALLVTSLAIWQWTELSHGHQADLAATA